jgi:hypothetical protein
MNRVTTLVLFLLIAACKEISFEQPQPEGRKSLTSIPRSLQGKYLAITDTGEPSKDTVVITAHGYRFGYFDPAEQAGRNDEYEKRELDDSTVLKAYKGYYFLNLNEKPEWILRVIRQEKNGDLTYMALEQKNMDFNDYLKKLSVEIKIDSTITDQETLYQIRPSPSQLVDLIHKGYFSSSRLVKIR